MVNEISVSEVKRGDIVRTPFGMMLVVNRDGRCLEGYEIRATKKGVRCPMFYGDEVELFDDQFRKNQ